MTITLIAAADEPRPQPGQPTPDPRPVTGSPWRPRYAQHRRATNPAPSRRPVPEWGPNSFTIAVCDGCGYIPGDGCDCAADRAELIRAFAPAGSMPGAYGPITLDLRGGAR